MGLAFRLRELHTILWGLTLVFMSLLVSLIFFWLVCMSFPFLGCFRCFWCDELLIRNWVKVEHHKWLFKTVIFFFLFLYSFMKPIYNAISIVDVALVKTVSVFWTSMDFRLFGRFHVDLIQLMCSSYLAPYYPFLRNLTWLEVMFVKIWIPCINIHVDCFFSSSFFFFFQKKKGFMVTFLRSIGVITLGC